MPRYIVEVDCTLQLNWLRNVEVEAPNEEVALQEARESVDYYDVAESMLEAAVADGLGPAEYVDAWIACATED